MIFTERKITISNNASSIDKQIVLYRGDKNVEIRFTISEFPFKYSRNNETNVIESSEASFGQLIIKVPNDRAPIFSDIVATKKGSVIFTITGEMIDEISELGTYDFQIRLFDDEQNSRATIPPIEKGIEIREPIAQEDVSDTNEVGVATVGYALTTAASNEDAFDLAGNYNKTTWGTGDRITASKLNKIEAGIDGVNQKVASGGSGQEVDLSAYQTKTDSTLNTTDKTVVGAINEINETMVIAEEQTGDITVGDIPTGGSNNASDITITDTNNNFNSDNVEGALNELFQSVSSGKSAIASAITDKGVITSSSDSFSTMATNIRGIPNQEGGITPTGTINITANGTVDVTNYATASINVEGSGDTTIVTTTNTNTLNKRGSKKLSFGVISDIHITTNTTNSANVKFANALDFFKAQSCNFVVMNGDIANYDKANELNTYGTMIADYTLPIYEIMGNHDAGTGTSTTEDEWTTLTGNTFKFEIISNDEVFLFLSQRKWSDYSTAENNRMLTQEDKDWLSGKLESYKNKPRVFLFHHQYLDNCEGFAYRNGTESNSYIVNDADYWTNIVSTYKNVTWFSGHSHSPFSLQTNYPNNTVYNKNGEYCNMIHVPSLTSGQYYIVTVYDGLFEIQGYQDGTKVDSAYYIIGNYSSSSSSSTENKTTYAITNNLTNVTNSNLYLSIEEGNAYTATLTATDGYNITSVAITMGGNDITSTVYSGGSINIPSVTGDIVITASAEEIVGTYYTITNNLNNATTSNSTTSVEENSSYSATITANNNYELSSITVTMGGIDISSTAVSGANISISSVTGNIIITVTTTAIYTITNTLSNASTNNSSTTAKSGTSYTATITANDGYVIDTVTVTMGGTDITSNSYSNGVITINSVTGNIVITVTTAVQLTKTVAYSKASQTFNFTSSLKTIQIETGTLATTSTFTELPIPLEAGKKYYMRCESLKYSDGTDVSMENDKIYVTGMPYSGDTKLTNKIAKDYSNIVGVDVLLTQDTGILITSYGSSITKIAQLALKISSSSPKISSLPFTVTMTNFEIFTYGESI